MITQTQASIIANALTEIRPDWNWQSLMTLLEANCAHPATFADTLVAAVTKAQDTDLRTPAAIWNPGPHWPDTSRDAVTAHSEQGPRCEDHTTEPAATCPCCIADVKCGDRTEAQVGKRLNPSKPVPAPDASRAQGQKP